MSKRIVAAVVLSWLLASFDAAAQTAVAPGATNAPVTAAARLPGDEIAQTVSIVTGVAISPLFGVGAIGAWQYSHAKTPEEKARLQWYANPWFWVPALVLVALCFIKDTAGTALPTILKKPLDIAETIENKVSALVAAGLFVPLAASIFGPPAGDGAAFGWTGLAVIDLSWFANGIMVLLALVIFFFVFLASNAINVLILLSPFTTLDAALKGFRAVVLGTVVATAWANPWLGAVWALGIIIFSYCIAGWSFRLSWFGAVFTWDFVTRRSRRFTPAPDANKMFLSRKVGDVPARTYGELSRGEQETLVLKYRPWLVLAERALRLPPGQYEAGRGLFYSEITRVENDSRRTVLLLPPRYLGHEEELAKIYGLSGTRDAGIRAMWAWIREWFGKRPWAAPAQL